MVCRYKRKTERQSWDVGTMTIAMKAVEDGMSFRKAAKQFKVPVMSLLRRCKEKNKQAVKESKCLGSRQCVFSVEQENELVAHILDMGTRMYGLTTVDARSIAYQLAVKYDVVHPFSNEKQLAGKDWLIGFCKRHPEISLRRPESTSVARAQAFNRPVVTKFFLLLEDIHKKQFLPHRIFNVDETSLSTVPGHNSKFFAKKGRKPVGRVSAERGPSATAVICMSAGGCFIPPMLISCHKSMKQELKDGAPPGTVFVCNDSGWTRVEVFSMWFDHFLAYTKPSADDPVLLILDGHLSHTKNLEVIEKARQHFVIILCIPPHCTHKLQPLDVGMMFQLNHYLDTILAKWLNMNPGRIVTVFQIAKIFGEAYMQTSTPINAVNGFKKTGIFPFDPNVFTDKDFETATTTDQGVSDTPIKEHEEPPLDIVTDQPGCSKQTTDMSESFFLT